MPTSKKHLSKYIVLYSNAYITIINQFLIYSQRSVFFRTHCMLYTIINTSNFWKFYENKPRKRFRFRK